MYNPPPEGLRGPSSVTQPPPINDPNASLWDQLAANVLLTVQAMQQLHHAFDQRFTR